MSIFGEEDTVGATLEQAFNGSVSFSKSKDGTTTLRIITPHVECPSPQEVYELDLPRDLLQGLLEFPDNSHGTIENLSVNHISDGDDDDDGDNDDDDDDEEEEEERRNGHKRKRL